MRSSDHVGSSDPRTVGPSNHWIIGPPDHRITSDHRIFGSSDHWTLRSSCRNVSGDISMRRAIGSLVIGFPALSTYRTVFWVVFQNMDQLYHRSNCYMVTWNHWPYTHSQFACAGGRPRLQALGMQRCAVLSIACFDVFPRLPLPTVVQWLSCLADQSIAFHCMAVDFMSVAHVCAICPSFYHGNLFDVVAQLLHFCMSDAFSSPCFRRKV